MKTSIISSLLILGLGANLYALNVPESAKADKRMTFAQYDANDVFLINAKNGYVSMVKFADDERIVNIATGFSDGWDLVDKENFLFIKPKSYVAQPTEQQQAYDEDGNQIQYDQSLVIQPNEEDWKTNLIVTTNKRIYVFDLSLQSSKKTNYRVEFLYPLDLQAAAASEQLAKERAKAEEEIEKDLKRTTIPRNWEFYMHVNKGSETIAPDFAYDDGVFTYLGFNSTKTIPSVFLYDETNKESILNTHLKKDGKFDVLVIHQTAKQILLRSGNKLVGIMNSGYAKNPLEQTRETTGKSVSREITQ